MRSHLKDLGHFELPEAAREYRRLQGPGHEVRGGGEADGAAGIGLSHIRDARGEVHKPAIAVRIAHHPGVAHRPVVPVADGVVLLVVRRGRAGQVEAEAVADAGPGVQVGRRGVADALVQPESSDRLVPV